MATTNELRLGVEEIWPGCNASQAQMEAALALAKELGLATTNDSLQWVLTAEGLTDVQRHGAWATDLKQRVTSEIRVRSREGLGYEPDSIEAELWLNQLVKALITAIEKSQAMHLGRVDQLVHGQIAPRDIDQQEILQKLEAVSANAEVIEFLKSLAISALDPLDSFGTELVSQITTGCILHSYVSGRSGSEITNQIGAPSNQRAILDTPVLLSLVGRSKDRKNAELTIKSAVASGWDVVVGAHSMEELNQLLQREVPAVEKRFREAYKNDTKLEFYATLVDDQIQGMLIGALQDGTYKNLTDLLTTAGRLESDLESWGAHVREHHNQMSQEYVIRCIDAMNGQVNNSSRARSAQVIERDAHSMTMAWRRRRREESSNWPGAWVITSDRQIAPAYASISTDRVSLTLTLPQWTTVVSISAPLDDLRELASAAAGQFVEESMWQLPARFPGDFAMSLASQLSPNQGGSDMDLRHAQMMLSLPEMLDELATTSSPTAIAATVLAARTKRVEAIANREKVRDRNAFAQANILANDANEAAQRARISELEAKNDKIRLETELANERVISSNAEARLTATKTRHRRVLWSIALVALTCIFPIVGILAANTFVAVVGVILTLTMAFVSVRWCRDLRLALHVVAWAAIVEGLGLVTSVLSLMAPGQIQ